MYICDEHGLHGKGDECPKCLGVDKMNNDLREQLAEYLEWNDISSDNIDELITIIRKATLDEVDEAIYIEQPYTPAKATKVIDNLRGAE